MIFPNVPGLQIHLIVDSEPLKERQKDEDSDDAENTVRYVESSHEKNFKVEVLFKHNFEFKDAVRCCVYIDGHKVRELIFSRKDKGHPFGIDGIKTSDESGQWFKQSFVFAQLETDDGSIKSSQLKSYKDLGTIQVTFQHVEREGRRKPSTKSTGRSHLGGDKERIPEKGLKGRAISTQIRPGDLQIEGIIPRTRPPTPLEDRDPNDLSLAEAQELVRRLRDQKAQQMSIIKQEINVEKRGHAQIFNFDEDELEVTGSSCKRLRVVQESGMDVLDLTDD
nr:hypothetical protein CFP56_07979 [Quercus suber]